MLSYSGVWDIYNSELENQTEGNIHRSIEGLYVIYVMHHRGHNKTANLAS